MSKQKSGGKDKAKAGQLVIRVDKAERAAFIALCEAADTTAAREIRRFMRESVAAGNVAAAGRGGGRDMPDATPQAVDEASSDQDS